jgi:LysR family transcriptional regulator, cyn operon transcriptional activator
MAMNLRHLRTFVAIADAGGVGRACEQLHLSQPAASRQISLLEGELGVRLFDRIGRRLHLTSDGEDLLARSRRLLTEALSLNERALALRGGQTGILRIAAASQCIEAWIASFLVRFQRRYPGIDIRVLEDQSGNLAKHIQNGDVHLAQMPAGDEQFHCRALYPTHALAVLPKFHKFGRRRVIEVGELANEPLLLLRRDSLVRHWIEAACTAAHVKPKIWFESDVRHSLIAFAKAGQGIAVVPSNGVIGGGDMHAAPIVFHGKPIGRWSVIAWHPERFLPPYVHRFVEEMVPFAERHNPGRRYIKRSPPLPKPQDLEWTLSCVS